MNVVFNFGKVLLIITLETTETNVELKSISDGYIHDHLIVELVLFCTIKFVIAAGGVVSTIPGLASVTNELGPFIVQTLFAHQVTL